MEDWNEDDDVVTRMKYRGNVVKVVVSEINEEAIRIVDTSGLTDVTMMVIVSRLLWNRIVEGGSIAAFTNTLQLVAVQMIDAKLNRDA